MASTIVLSIVFTISLWFIFWLLILYFQHTENIKKCLLEPMFKFPIVIFESDDWGTGSFNQQTALTRINTLLAQYTDSTGSHPVMTLGVILAEPDVAKIKASNQQIYYKRTLADSRYAKLREAIQQGIDQGTFAVHLHGMEHFWPASLMQSAQNNPQVQQWLFNNDSLQTEDLPSELQSRWVDSSQIPSREHSPEDIQRAIDEELSLYAEIFGQTPKIVVPPTFVWTDEVEKAYAARGIEVWITPGRQCTGRDKQRLPKPNGRLFWNGQEQGGLLFLVRNNYFEPSIGHTAETALQGILAKTQCGRPALLETHRFNFIDETENNSSLQELDKLLQLMHTHLPNVRFMSVTQLAKIMKDHNRGITTEVIVDSKRQRTRILFARIKSLLQFNRIAKYSGINFLLKAV